jgi:branched-chain amino acid transport system substrate-binding protein
VIPALALATGPVAFWFIEHKWAMEQAVADINAAGGANGIPLRLKWYVVDASNAEAVMAANKVVRDNPLISSSAVLVSQLEAMASVYESNGILCLGTLSDTTLQESFGGNMMGIINNDTRETLGFVTVCHNREPDIKSVVAIYSPDVLTYELTHNGNVAEAQRLGLEVKSNISFSMSGTVDYGAIVAKAISYGADGYIFDGNSPDIAQMILEFHNKGVTDNRRFWVSVQGSGHPMFLELLHGEGDGVYGTGPTNWDPEGQTEAYQRLAQGEIDELKTEPSTALAITYDTIMPIKLAIERSGVTGAPAKRDAERQKLWDTLYNLGDFPSIQGFNYSIKNGIFSANTFVYQIQNGKRVWIDRHELTDAELGR